MTERKAVDFLEKREGSRAELPGPPRRWERKEAVEHVKAASNSDLILPATSILPRHLVLRAALYKPRLPGAPQPLAGATGKSTSRAHTT